MFKRTVEYILVVFIVSGIAVGLYYGKHRYFEVSVATLAFHSECARTPAETLKSAVLPELHQTWGRLKLSALKERLEALPWIERADVYRRWPQKVVVNLTEYAPVARWGYDGLITEQGYIFYPEEVTAWGKLPILWGQEQERMVLLHHYQVMAQILEKVGISVKQLKNMPDQGWQAMLDNGLVIMLGKSKFEERLNRFAFAYKIKFHKEVRTMAYMDMRYINGLAVGR